GATERVHAFGVQPYATVSFGTCQSAYGDLKFLPLHGPPPNSPLFPYTTLFRSLAGTQTGGANRVPSASVLLLLLLAKQARTQNQDRKSTRLNSSHVAISYAVFCLKKNTLNPGAVRAAHVDPVRAGQDRVAFDHA